MKRKFFVRKALLIILFVPTVITVLTFVVMALWNSVLTEVISVKPVSFWQAMGILALSKILFGFGGGKGPGRHSFWWNKRMQSKMRSMSPEEREKFKEEMCRRINFWHMPDRYCDVPDNKKD
ncbi:hypothetical protein [Arcticibacter tournemirensis]|uniref:Uncharacterized protein n=1 Tax=Arcticibacter tournemirensis TaxID=699437 RepID=A0A4Q0M7P0_9SPHI|nr:hypothetical protein [Arcticibacter tournemirensis]RXF68903.1 hypothetical protein EKH83_14370 [Arcticibacter tournemirensis]